MQEVLIVTQKIDPHSDVVIAEIQKLGGKVLRLNTESFLDFYSINLGLKFDSFCGNLSDKFERQVDLTRLTSAYFRRPSDVTPHPELTIDGAKEFSIKEGELALKFIYTFPNLKWVNNPFDNNKAEVKFNQLYTASQLGLKIPNTLVTNNPQAAKKFFKELNNRVLCKSLKTNTVQINSKDVHVFSHRLTESELDLYLDSIRFTPTLLQEYIEKEKEIRVNVIGNKVFATEIDSQILKEAEDDWRKVDPWSLPHRSIELPKRLERLLIEFVKSYNLYFSAIDLIKTPNGEYIFLENNPNGQWYWVELLTKQPLAKSIAELLLSKA